jgi:nitroreductase
MIITGGVMETFQAIMTRRSVRKYKDMPIPDDLLGKMLDAAKYAPSWANTQCFRCVVVKDNAVKNKLSQTLPPKNPGFNSLLTAPLVIVAFAEKFKSGFYKGECSTNKGDYWYMFDTALALENIVLTAWENGVGSVYLGLFDAEKAGEILNIPENCEVVAMIPFGYPDEEPKCPPRRDLRLTVHYESYSEPKVE